MKFKLDENFGTRTQNIFKSFGHDVHTIREEALQGAPDQKIYQVCCDEERCLVTLDLDFSDVVRFPPHHTAGIAAIRFPRNPSLPLLENLVRQFLQMLEKQSINKQLWIIEVGRIRIHQSDIDDE